MTPRSASPTWTREACAGIYNCVRQHFEKTVDRPIVVILSPNQEIHANRILEYVPHTQRQRITGGQAEPSANAVFVTVRNGPRPLTSCASTWRSRARDSRWTARSGTEALQAVWRMLLRGVPVDEAFREVMGRSLRGMEEEVARFHRETMASAPARPWTPAQKPQPTMLGRSRIVHQVEELNRISLLLQDGHQEQALPLIGELEAHVAALPYEARIWVFLYRGYALNLAGKRQEAVTAFARARDYPATDWVKNIAEKGIRRPLVWGEIF